MKLHIFGNTTKPDRQTAYPKAMNDTAEELLWDAFHPTKGSVHFGYDHKTAAAIVVAAYVTEVITEAWHSPDTGNESARLCNAVAELVLSDAGFTATQRQKEFSRIRLDVLAGLLEATAPHLQLVS